MHRIVVPFWGAKPPEDHGPKGWLQGYFLSIMNENKIFSWALASFGAGNERRVMHNLPGCTSPFFHPQHPK